MMAWGDWNWRSGWGKVLLNFPSDVVVINLKMFLFWLLDICVQTEDQRFCSRGIKNILSTHKTFLWIPFWKDMSLGELIHQQCRLDRHPMMKRKSLVLRRLIILIHKRRPQESYSLRKALGKLFKIHKRNKGNVGGWSVTNKRPECPFVCHTLTINQRPWMFGILNDLIHSVDMFIVDWKLLRKCVHGHKLNFV